MTEQLAGDAQPADDAPQPKWRPLSSIQRRILGVLVEKAKTTPNGYPITLNGLTTGCNQKSNRDPHMELKPDQVEAALDQLREMGAVAEIQGDGRVPKYRHYLYEWLGVDKVELSVMAELLLRGEQSVGDLRGRAARMDPIDSVEALRPILQGLMQKNLVIALTPEGRGQIVAHNLYPERDLADLRRQYAGSSGGSAPSPSVALSPSPAPAIAPALASAPAPPPRAAVGQVDSASPPAAPRPAPAVNVPPDVLAELRVEVGELRAMIARMREDLRAVNDVQGKVDRLEKQVDEFRRLLE
jgi:uncharacterized protein YceH (UPF0502 family)